MASRIIAIGDIHGCSAALRSLTEIIAPQADDTLIPLGDCVDRGPDSCGVLEQLLILRDRCRLFPLLGNHEEMMLNYLDGPSATRRLAESRRRRDAGIVQPELRSAVGDSSRAY